MDYAEKVGYQMLSLRREEQVNSKLVRTDNVWHESESARELISKEDKPYQFAARRVRLFA
jgi:hypothetical protein